MNRILVIGLDGASPHLIEKWREDLPHLAKLQQQGSSGVLQSVIPPRSIPAWYCFAAGMNPAKLGVFGFSQRQPSTYDYTFANFTHCQAPPFWHWLNRQGISTAVIHLPGTFPPRPLQGFMVSGWPGPLNRGSLVYTYPDDLSREIDKFLGRPFELVSPGSIRRDNDAEMLAERLRILQMHGDTAYHLLAERPWQVGVVVLSPLDRASHQFWRHMDANHPQHNPEEAKQFGSALKQIYQAHDAQVGRLLELVDEDDWVFIVSDHGFGPVRRTFYLNEWLRQKGYLVLRDETAAGSPSLARRVVGALSRPLFHLNNASPAFRRLADPFKKRALSNFVRDAYVQAKEEGLVRLNHLPVDWNRTRAYCPDESSLYLNLRGRDPQGIVEPGSAAQALLDEIERELSRLQDPHTGQPITVQLRCKEDVYSGPFLKDAPEMIVDMDDYQTEVMAELEIGRLVNARPLRSGNHTLEGTLIAKGPGIPAGQTRHAGLIDIAPTILHLLNVPVPQDMDGRVQQKLFAPEFDAARRAVVRDTAVFTPDASQTLSEEEQAQVEKQLRDLGYLN